MLTDHTRVDQDIELPGRHGGDVVRRGRDGPILSREGLRVTCSRAESYNRHLLSFPSSFKMSKDTNAQAAAAQMMVDDEPDDW